MLTQDGPQYPNWDQDATAVQDRYAEQDPAAVSAELAAAAEIDRDPVRAGDRGSVAAHRVPQRRRRVHGRVVRAVLLPRPGASSLRRHWRARGRPQLAAGTSAGRGPESGRVPIPPRSRSVEVVMTGAPPERHIAFDRLHNFRDFGGYAAAGGRQVRWGQLYRSDSLGKLAGLDLERFAALGVRTVVDLRYPWEADAAAGCLPPPASRTTTAALSTGPTIRPRWPRSSTRCASWPTGTRRSRPTAEAEIGQALRIIAGDCAPLVVHCASGKDRTGHHRRARPVAARRHRGRHRRRLRAHRPRDRPPDRGLARPSSRQAAAVAALRGRAGGADARVPG